MDPWIIVFGLGVGILVGATGMGGGSIMTPLLIVVVGVKPVLAIGTDLAYGAVTKTLGAWRHYRQGTVDLGISTWLGVGSIPGALGGVWALSVLESAVGADFDTMLLSLVAGALLLTGTAVLARALFAHDPEARERDTIALARRHRTAAIVIGLCVGFVLGITSAGSGALIGLALIMVFRLTPRRVVGTDVFHAAVLLWVAALAHVASGNVDFALAGTILIGSLPGVWIGSRLAVRVPQSVLRTALGVVLLAAGMGLLAKAGAPLPPAVLIGTPLALAVLATLRQATRPRTAVV
jgi:uncharacterized membrane protein YfcA